MTTKELIKKLEDMGYAVDDRIEWLWIRKSPLSYFFMGVHKDSQYEVTTFTGFKLLNKFDKKQLWEVAKEYIETPVDERIEKDKLRQKNDD